MKESLGWDITSKGRKGDDGKRQEIGEENKAMIGKTDGYAGIKMEGVRGGRAEKKWMNIIKCKEK